MNHKKRIAVLGGGVTGITLAGELSKCPLFEIDLIESYSALGGFHRNVEIDGVQYDIGTFGFFGNHNLFKAFPSIVSLYQPTSVNYGSVTGKNSLDRYPLTLKGYIKNQGLASFFYSCLEILYSKLRYRKKDTVPAFAKYYMGANVYQKSGLKKYIERLYQIADRDIDMEFAHKRLFFVREIGSLRKIVSRKLKGKYLLTEPNKTYLVRPKEGFKKIYSTLHEILLSRGVNVKLNSKIQTVRRKEEKFEIELADGTETYDEVVSTIPIPVMSRLIGKPLEKGLESMNLLTLFYRFKGDLKHDYSVLHNFTEEGAWKRITLFSEYYGKHEGDDYFCVEITLNKDSEPDVAQQRQQFESHLQSLGLFEGDFKFQESLLTKNAYPVYLISNVEHIPVYKKQLLDWGLRLAGRQGEFNYLSSSDATANAMQVANDIKKRYQEEIQQLEELQTQETSVL